MYLNLRSTTGIQVWACAGFTAAMLWCWAPAADAALIAGPWANAAGQGNGPIDNSLGAGNVNVGDGTANSADGEMFHASFPQITLANNGDKAVFTGTMQLVGSVNSAASSGTPRTQFRFGLFKDDGDGDELEWTGYLMTNSHGTGTPAGSISRKPVGNTSAYLSTTGANSLVSTQGNGTVFNDDTFALSMSIERSGTSLVVTGTINGTATTNFSQSLNVADATPPTFSFDRLGFLLGGNLDADQAVFTNLDVRLVPEPSALLLLGMGGLAGLARRRN
jgi:hypothetical protein